MRQVRIGALRRSWQKSIEVGFEAAFRDAQLFGRGGNLDAIGDRLASLASALLSERPVSGTASSKSSRALSTF